MYLNNNNNNHYTENIINICFVYEKPYMRVQKFTTPNAYNDYFVKCYFKQQDLQLIEYFKLVDEGNFSFC